MDLFSLLARSDAHVLMPLAWSMNVRTTGNRRMPPPTNTASCGGTRSKLFACRRYCSHTHVCMYVCVCVCVCVWMGFLLSFSLLAPHVPHFLSLRHQTPFRSVAPDPILLPDQITTAMLPADNTYNGQVLFQLAVAGATDCNFTISGFTSGSVSFLTFFLSSKIPISREASVGFQS
jgi:hypothetical protein